MCHVSSRSGEATLRTAIHLLHTYLLLLQDAPFISAAGPLKPAPPSLTVAVASPRSATAALCSGIVTSPFSFMTSSDDVIPVDDDDSTWLASMSPAFRTILRQQHTNRWTNSPFAPSLNDKSSLYHTTKTGLGRRSRSDRPTDRVTILTLSADLVTYHADFCSPASCG